jgi:hypothetical protein
VAKKTVDPTEKNRIHIKGKKKSGDKKKLDPNPLKVEKKSDSYKGKKTSKKVRSIF